MVDMDTLNWTGPHGLRDRLSAIMDPRHRRGIRHSVDQVLVLALAAVVAGKRSYVAIGDWIHDLRPEQRAIFGCPRWGPTFKVLLALTGFVITSTNSRAIRYTTDQGQT